MSYNYLNIKYLPSNLIFPPYNQVGGIPLSTDVAPKSMTPYHQVSSSGTSFKASPSSHPIVEVAKLSYRGSVIRIFADAGVRNPRRFFYEPLVQLNPKSIFVHHHSVLQSDVVSFTIEMWNPELRRQVLGRVKSLSSFSNITIGEQDMNVLPFVWIEMGQIVGNGINIGLRGKSISYRLQSESLEFYMLSNSTIFANVLAENFRQNPGFFLDYSQMTFIGSSLDLGDQFGIKESKYTYPVSTPYSTSGSQKTW